MNSANCHSSTLKLTTKEYFNFNQPEIVYIYTDVIKRNLFGDPNVQLLTSLHFLSNTVYHRFDYPFKNQCNSPLYSQFRFVWLRRLVMMCYLKIMIFHVW